MEQWRGSKRRARGADPGGGSRRPGWWVLCGLLAGGGLALAACSSASSARGTAAADQATPAGATGTGGGGGTPKAPPGVSGTVAAVNAGSSSMEVQNPETGQTTVSWTASTRFVQTVSATLGAVRAGDCVAVSGTPAGGTSSTPTTVDAQLVTITAPPSGGSCTSRSTTSGGAPGGFAGFAGGFAAFGGGAARSSRTNSTPRTVASVDGTVQSVSGNTIVVQGFSRSFTITPGRRPTGSSRQFAGRRSTSTGSSLPTIAVTVQVTGTTSYRQTGPSTPSALAVGQCVTAIGPSSSTGAVTARTVAISQPGSSGCFAGVGRFGARGSSTGSGQASA